MSTQDRREREKEERRRQILEAARLLFGEKSYENCSMEEIAERAELSKGALYLYFKSKDELAFALIQGLIVMLYEKMLAQNLPDVSGLTRLRNMEEVFLSFLDASQDCQLGVRGFDFYHHVFENENYHATECVRQIQQILNLFVAAARDGQADGSVRADLDPEKTSISLANLVVSFLFRVASGQGLILRSADYQVKDLIRHTLSLLLDAVANRKEPS